MNSQLYLTRPFDDETLQEFQFSTMFESVDSAESREKKLVKVIQGVKVSYGPKTQLRTEESGIE